ncbi:MAG TPA: pyridoxine 5'-phosphate synthase [Alphaproteobacteria bacterium]|nr:pyridoxine 5'-phosphate synthase [Alphaproteobacteria bacterium]
MATKLSVNLNKVALLRNQRDVGYPDVLEAARTAIAAGAHGITVHPRPDERHVRRSDVTALADFLKAETGGAIEYNIEGNPFPDYMDLVERTRPHQATLVPDAPDAGTSDAGWDTIGEAGRLAPVIRDLKALGVRVSLFVDADPAMVRGARDVGADRVELYTGPYAHAFGGPDQATVLARYVEAAETARDAGLGLNAGHDLTRANLPLLRRAMPWLDEVSIGHALIADALWLGLDATVKAYLATLRA